MVTATHAALGAGLAFVAGALLVSLFWKWTVRRALGWHRQGALASWLREAAPHGGRAAKKKLVCACCADKRGCTEGCVERRRRWHEVVHGPVPDLCARCEEAGIDPETAIEAAPKET